MTWAGQVHPQGPCPGVVWEAFLGGAIFGGGAEVIRCLCPSPQALRGPSGRGPRPINISHYATKKTAAQSMLDVALLMANSSQLKTALYVGPQYRFYTPLMVLLSLSIALQVIVGLLLIFIGKCLPAVSAVSFTLLRFSR